MAILSAISLDDVVPLGEAARQLGISAQRARVLAASGQIEARKVAGRWFVARAAVERRGRDGRLSGRPLSPSHAWGLIALADGEPAGWLDPASRSRLRRVLREHEVEDVLPSLGRRRRRLALRAHPSDLSRIEAEPDLVRSGVSAASEHGLEILAPDAIEGYVPAGRLAALERRYHLQPSQNANVVLHVVRGQWPFARGRRVVPRLVAILDLLDHDDARSRRAGQRALKGYKARIR